MASLNTLRTKFGYVLSAIIAFALLAFIFSLKNDMGFSNNDPKVGEINSEDVLYSEYQAEYENVKRQSGATESTEQEAASLSNAAWQSLISKRLLQPGFSQLGLNMSEAERLAVINGEVATQSFGSVFTDPSTGVYNAAYLSEFLSQASTNPQIETAWTEINAQAREERAIMKFSALVRSGSYVNKLEVAQGVEAANNSYSGKWVSLPYSSMPDSLFNVSESEIKKYYQENKAAYRKMPTRSISYVSFSFEPTEQDIIDIENNALKVSKEFEQAENLNDYVRANLNGSITKNYMAASQLDSEELASFEDGKMYGPINKNNVWTMSRVASKLVAPDSVGIRHIVLNYTDNTLADSLVTALKGGASFAEAAQAHSLYAQTAQLGGEVGVMPFSMFTDEFIPALSSAKKGDIVKINTGDMIQILEVYKVGTAKAHYQVASVEYPVEASQATVGALHSDAGMFSVDATGSIEKFNGSASEHNTVVRTATIVNGDRTVRAINDSREIARWAFGAEVNDISDIFKTEDGYIVAMLTSVNDDEYRSVNEVASSIKSILIRDKKFAEAATTMSGSTIEAVAAAVDGEVKEFSGVKASAQDIMGIGYDPKAVGAVTLGNISGLSAPVQGFTAAYVFDVNPAEVSETQTEAMERARAQATVEDKNSQYIFNALQQMGNIQDLRGQYF